MILASNVLVVTGVALVALATLGLIRLPDVFTRAHAVAKAETLGLALVFIGVAFRPEATWDVVLRLVLLLGFAFIGNPTAVHAITRAARRAGLQASSPGEEDPELQGEDGR